MHHSLRGDHPHGGAHLSHLEVVLPVAVWPDSSIATDDPSDQLHVDIASVALREIPRRAHLEPDVEAEAIDVFRHRVQDGGLEVSLEIGQENASERRLCAAILEMGDHGL
jgi:hypothetical protein